MSDNKQKALKRIFLLVFQPLVRAGRYLEFLRIRRGYMKQIADYMPWNGKPFDRYSAIDQKHWQRFLGRKFGAAFGSGCFVSRYAKVFTDSLRMGNNSWIATEAFLRGDVEMGENCSVNAYTRISGRVRMGDNVRIGANVDIIGFNHRIDETDIPICKQGLKSEGITIEDDVFIGASAIILDGVKIGSNSFIGANAVVTNDIPKFSIAGGIPAKVIRNRKQDDREKDGEVRDTGAKESEETTERECIEGVPGK